MVFGNGTGWFLTVLLLVAVVAGAGWLLSDRQKMDSQINSLLAEIKSITNENTALKSEIEKSKTLVDELTKREGQFKTLVENQMAQIEALKNQVNEKDRIIQALTNQNNLKDHQISEMRQTLDAYPNQLSTGYNPTTTLPVSEIIPGGQVPEETPQASLWFVPAVGLCGLIGVGGTLYIPRIRRKQLIHTQQSKTSYMVRMNRDQYYQYTESIQKRAKPDQMALTGNSKSGNAIFQ
jgi:hypothetical protein